MVIQTGMRYTLLIVASDDRVKMSWEACWWRSPPCWETTVIVAQDTLASVLLHSTHLLRIHFPASESESKSVCQPSHGHLTQSLLSLGMIYQSEECCTKNAILHDLDNIPLPLFSHCCTSLAILHVRSHLWNLLYLWTSHDSTVYCIVLLLLVLRFQGVAFLSIAFLRGSIHA